MMKRCYSFSGLELLVEIAEECAYRDEGRLAPFRADCVTDPHRFVFERVKELHRPTGQLIVSKPNFRLYAMPGGHIRYTGGENAYIRGEHVGKLHRIQVKENPYTDVIGVKTVLDCLEIEHLLAGNHAYVFHCSYIIYGGKAILFTAPSGMGKSTQAELWAEHRGAVIVNGDRAAVRVKNGIFAEGIPFAGSSRYCSKCSLPIMAIVYLGQAPQTSIRRLQGYEAFSGIWEGVSVNTWDRADMEIVSGLVQQTAREIPIYRLLCTPDLSAVMALEYALRKQEIL